MESAETMKGEVVAVCISIEVGTRKKPVAEARVIEDFGIEGDAHARKWHRQISLLAEEDAQSMRDMGADIKPGDFAENLLIRGMAVSRIPVGTRIGVGTEVVLEVTQIGKACHSECEIARQVGTCVMPKKGIFAKVLKGGVVRPGDEARTL